MAKYSFEIKKQVIQSYLNGDGGCNTLAKKYGISNECIVRRWVHAYEEYGNDGLMRSRKNKSYTFEFKLHVVELYLTTEVSYQQLALSVGINNPPLIVKWVNDFRIAGSDALRLNRKGRHKSLESSMNSIQKEQLDIKPVDTSAGHVNDIVS